MLALVLGVLVVPAAAVVPPPPGTGDTSLGDSGSGDSGLPNDSGIYQGPGDTALPLDTSDTGLPPPTVDTGPLADSGPVFCDNCLSAAGLAGERGGSPCDQGCSSTGAAGASVLPALVAGLAVGAWVRRPRGRSLRGPRSARR